MMTYLIPTMNCTFYLWRGNEGGCCEVQKMMVTVMELTYEICIPQGYCSVSGRIISTRMKKGLPLGHKVVFQFVAIKNVKYLSDTAILIYLVSLFFIRFDLRYYL